ncbi:MAG: hypothetical protein V1826_00720 [bacterium]
MATKKKLLAELQSCPPMKCDEKGWEAYKKRHSGDELSLLCFDYAECWARFIQKGLAEGRSLAEIADECQRKAHQLYGRDLSGGAMSCGVIPLLVKLWDYGEDFRRWHNRQTQVGREGEHANKTGGILDASVINCTPRR